MSFQERLLIDLVLLLNRIRGIFENIFELHNLKLETFHFFFGRKTFLGCTHLRDKKVALLADQMRRKRLIGLELGHAQARLEGQQYPEGNL